MTVDQIKGITEGKIEIVHTIESEIHIIDYTEQTKSARGIEIVDRKPEDTNTLMIENRSQIQIYGCIFGHQSLTDSHGKDIPHCEAVLFPSESTAGTWMLFVEIKDCEPKNIAKHFSKSKEQIIQTVAFFREKGLIPEKKRVHAVISFPRRNKIDFHNQLIKTGERKFFFDRYRIIIKGTNHIKVRSIRTLV